MSPGSRRRCGGAAPSPGSTELRRHSIQGMKDRMLHFPCKAQAKPALPAIRLRRFYPSLRSLAAITPFRFNTLAMSALWRKGMAVLFEPPGAPDLRFSKAFCDTARTRFMWQLAASS
jgi:hypothetical protein